MKEHTDKACRWTTRTVWVNLSAYVMALHSKAQIGMTNAGGIRWGILKGEITLSDIFQVLPFANRCVVLNIRGGELLDILRRSDRTPGRVRGGASDVRADTGA